MARYDQRLLQYQQGGLSYNDFVNANLVDSMNTAFATNISLVGGEIAGWSINALGLGKLATAAGAGATGGALFDSALQSGLMDVYQVTNGRTGQKDFSLSELMESTAIGAGAGAGAVGLFSTIGKLIGVGSDPIRAKIDPNEGESSPTDMVEFTPAINDGNAIGLYDTDPGELSGGEHITIDGNDAFTAPTAQSMTLGEAEMWYRDTVGQIANMVDKAKPKAVQVRQALELRGLIRDAAAGALVDTSETGRFLERHQLPSLDEIKTTLKKNYSGDALLDQELKSLCQLMRENYPETDIGCFVEGTLVWTDNGLVPIEKLKPGDMVLSQPESTGEKQYKRILNTFVFEDKEIWHLSYYEPSQEEIHQIFATGNHPFWVKDFGWVSVENLEPGQSLEFTDGTEAILHKCESVYRTEQKNIGFVTSSFVDDDLGFLIDLDDHFSAISDGGDSLVELVAKDDPFVRRRVFNIEVEDFHTYYVGKHGLWAHNTNCGTSHPLQSFQSEPVDPARSDALPSGTPELTATEIGTAFPNPAQGGLVIVESINRKGAAGKLEQGTYGARVDSATKQRVEPGLVFKNEDKATHSQVKNYRLYDGFKYIGNILQMIDRKLSFGPLAVKNLTPTVVNEVL